MLSNIGNLLLFTCLFLSLITIYFSYQDLNNNRNIVSKKIYQASLLQSTFIFVSFFTLIFAYIVSDFSVISVYQNSHSMKPLFYKISGSWGNHEGSLMLWVIILVFFSFLFLVANKNHPKNYRLYTLIIQNVLIIGFIFFILYNSNPFSIISPKPLEGLGLNPILQDPALAIHPPLLYVGFVGSSIYFSAAIASLITNYSNKFYAKSIKNWVIISWTFQTLGILAGSVWAYYELGWGGFWFWDPVENSSLLPWFAMTALMHSLMVLEKRNQFYFWVITLCLLTFILSVTGTFLVRSGILNSVHTFANDPARGLYILIFLSIMILGSMLIFFKKFKSQNIFLHSNSKETFILINNWFMIFYLITILLGTIYPIFTEVLFEHKVSVGPPFYNSLIIPIVIFFLVLMAIGPQTKWIKSKFANKISLLKILLWSVVINFSIIYFFKSYSILSNFIIITSIFLIFSSLMDISKLRKITLNDIPRIISHCAFGFLVFFIGLNYNFSLEQDFNLKKGQTKKFDNYLIDFKNLKLEERKNYKVVIGEFEIQNFKSNSIKFLNPEIRIYESPTTLTYEASIRTGLFKDYYLTMSNIDRSDYYNIKFQKKPFMLWIWISVIFISIGGFLRLFRNEKQNY
tara:strand:+ start:738 stop:2624 length:1887 start_codon:yes stop_codon:yes gene_type:complete